MGGPYGGVAHMWGWGLTGQYLYMPCPLDVEIIPKPIIHELLKPGPHLDGFWLRTFPKKLRDPLQYQSRRQIFGWGIHIDEGVNWPVVLPCAMTVLVLAGLLVVLYGILKGDWSSAAGLGAYLVSLLAFAVTIRYYAWENRDE